MNKGDTMKNKNENKRKCTILVSDVNNGGGYACVGAEGIWDICLLSSQFCYKPKANL